MSSRPERRLHIWVVPSAVRLLRAYDPNRESKADEGLVIRDIWLLRLRALLAQAHGDTAYTHFRDRYRDMARTLGFEGHITWAEAMR